MGKKILLRKIKENDYSKEGEKRMRNLNKLLAGGWKIARLRSNPRSDEINVHMVKRKKKPATRKTV